MGHTIKGPLKSLRHHHGTMAWRGLREGPTLVPHYAERYQSLVQPMSVLGARAKTQFFLRVKTRCTFFFFLSLHSSDRVSTGPSKPQKALERLTSESGLRKPYKALVLEMEPYKMEKNFFIKRQKKCIEPQKIFVK